MNYFSLCSREFKIEDGKAVIPLGITVQGDVLIVIYHARSTLGGRLQAKVSAAVATGWESQLLDSHRGLWVILTVQ